MPEAPCASQALTLLGRVDTQVEGGCCWGLPALTGEGWLVPQAWCSGSSWPRVRASGLWLASVHMSVVGGV